MKRKNFILGFVVGIIAITAYNFFSASTVTIGYREQINQERKEKDEIFRNSEDSPLTQEQKEVFKSLSYFPVSEKYIVRGDFRRNTVQQIIKMAITDGSQREYFVFGNVHFHLDGKELDLIVYKPVKEEHDYLFIPFYDKTSSESTYGGGRYVEPELIDNMTLEIDFNLAYNPYCVYNHTYRCPIPPGENSLDVGILAGEKMPDFVH